MRAVPNGKLPLATCELWPDDAFTRFISLAIVKINVFGFEFAIIISEFRAILHRSAIGVNGRFIAILEQKNSFNLF